MYNNNNNNNNNNGWLMYKQHIKSSVILDMKTTARSTEFLKKASDRLAIMVTLRFQLSLSQLQTYVSVYHYLRGNSQNYTVSNTIS